MTASNTLAQTQCITSVSVGLLLAATLLVMAMATISPALPGLAEKYSATPGVDFITRYLVAAPALSALMFAPLSGMISDRFGHGRTLRLSTLAYVLFGSSGLILNQLELILASRLLLGLSLALIITSQNALIGELFTGDKRQRFLGWQVSARNAGGLIFVVLGGILAGFSAQSVFAVYAMTLLFLPFIWKAGGTRHNFSGRHKAPRLRSDWLGPVYKICALQTIILVLFFTMPTQLPFALSAQGFDDPRLTSLCISGLMITGVIAGMAYGWQVRRLGQTMTIALGFLQFTAGFGILTLPGIMPLFFGPALVGSGYAILMASTAALALAKAPTENRGFVMGLLASAIFLGQAISPIISTPLISSLGFATFFALFGAIAAVFTAIFTIRTKRFVPQRQG